MLSSSEIKHIAGLAKLRLSAEEVQGLGADLSRVLDYIALLDGVAVDETVAKQDTDPQTRADVPSAGLDVEAFLNNAPKDLDRFLLVPAIK